MERIKTLTENFIKTFKISNNIDSFYNSLESFGIVDPLKFSATNIFFKEENFLTSQDGQISSLESKDWAILFKLTTQVGRIEPKKIEGVFILLKTDFPLIYTILTLSTNEFWEKGLFRYLHKRRPYILISRLTQKEMKEILKTFQNNIIPESLQIKRISSKRWYVSQIPSQGHKKLGSRIDWEEITLDEAFMEAKEEGKLFQNIVFEILDRNFSPTGFQTKVSILGFLQTNYWYPSFKTSLLESLIFIFKEKIKLFSKRSRKETQQNEPKPLIIYFDEEEVFKDKEKHEEFINILKKLPNLGYSLIHGNPYIHMLLIDYLDGSSHELLVLERDRVLIIPQIKATESSIERITNHILEKFRGGKVIDYDEKLTIRRTNTGTT